MKKLLRPINFLGQNLKIRFILPCNRGIVTKLQQDIPCRKRYIVRHPVDISF